MSCNYNIQGDFSCKISNINLNNYDVVNNTAVYGYNNYKSSNDDVLSCADLCNKDKKCAAFFVNNYNKSCNLTTSIEGSEFENNSVLLVKKK